MTSRRLPVAVALDAPDVSTAVSWASALAQDISVAKVGLELFTANGPEAVTRIAATGLDIFLDLKLHDIPATVAGAARAAARLSPTYLTVHALGGAAMIRAAAEAASDVLITAVTILTSHDAADLDSIGVLGDPASAALRLATLAVDAGARALVCSPQEVAAIRQAVGSQTVLITPGVRLAGGDKHDQRRVATPAAALAAGADLVVVGRALTAAPDMRAAVRALADDIAKAPDIARHARSD